MIFIWRSLVFDKKSMMKSNWGWLRLTGFVDRVEELQSGFDFNKKQVVKRRLMLSNSWFFICILDHRRAHECLPVASSSPSLVLSLISPPASVYWFLLPFSSVFQKRFLFGFSFSLFKLYFCIFFLPPVGP